MELIKDKFLNGEIHKLDVDSIVDFFENNYPSNISDTGIDSFLKALKIPVKYFLKQPRETQLELLENQRVSMENSKSLIFLSRKNVFEYCTLQDDSSFLDLTETTPVNSSWVFLREELSSGYIKYFIPSDKMSNTDYNLGVFVDYPVLFSKPMIVHVGFYKINPSDTELSSELYVPDTKIKLKNTELPNTEHNSYFIDMIDAVKNDNFDKLISKLETFSLDTDSSLINLLTFEKEKLINKNVSKKVRKYISKESIVITNLEELTAVLSLFSHELKSSSARNTFRMDILNSMFTLLKIPVYVNFTENFKEGY